MSSIDAAARRRALEPLESFCVSAPAGSGKTGLLVQRFMRLLSRVEEPERVVAITFTRKAAAEMRARVSAALGDAARALPLADEHQRVTREIADELLATDSGRGWQLRENPGRLRILTIDAFCGELVRQMPLLSGCGGPMAVTDDASALYREAFEGFMQRGFESGGKQAANDLGELLLHLDNDWEQAAELLTSLLARRDQWLPLFGLAGLGEGHLGDLLVLSEQLVAFRIDALRQLLAPWLDELEALACYRREHSPDRPVFDPGDEALDGWLDLVDLLLTRKGEWRSKVDRRDGFPAGKGEPAVMKQRVQELLAALRDIDDPQLLFALLQLRWLPDTHADEAHWARLRSVSRLLPRLFAELLLVFQRRGEVDHTQIAMSAIDALGDDDRPTELALRLDYSVDHLLVDEFQDTSSGQFELLRRLTRGWADFNAQYPQQARTLFLVGDPMQSIYGFREANVGLFIKARDEGVGDLSLESLQLRMNFRSSARIVTWVNDNFADAFPAVDDEQLGAVSYQASRAVHDMGETPLLTLFAGDGGEAAEAEHICERLREGLDDPEVRSIAILGRARRHLRPIVAALRRHGIEFAAHELDPLAGRPLIDDLLSLCAVLGNHGDRFSWLSLLRVPAIALDNADLLRAARLVPLAKTLLSAPNALLQEFSEEGRARLLHLRSVLRWAEQYRDRLALRVWVEETWLRIAGAASAPDRGEREDAEQFFQLLERLEQGGAVFSAAVLETAVSTLYAAGGDPGSRLQVMTLHKAKGLEFDWVFLPALAQSQAERGRELMLWDELVLPERPAAFLLDLRPRRGDTAGNRLYDYLKELRREKRRLEAVRLFYVGCTRAARRLFLSAAVDWDEEAETGSPAPAASMLGGFRSLQDRALIERASAPPLADQATARYRRLAVLPPVEDTVPSARSGTVDLSSNLHARSLGTAVHRALESLVFRERLPSQCDAPLIELLRFSLLGAGCELAQTDPLLAAGEAMLQRVLADDWARWMLDPQRAQRVAELPVTLLDESEGAEGPRQLIVDYSFVDENSGERWIVDYKTARPAPDVPESVFVAQQLEEYASQLTAYRRALELIYPQPVRCALYFTALGRHGELTTFP